MFEGIVLVRTPFREYDEVISIITRDFGRVDVLAKGVKKITSKLSSHLLLPSHIFFDCIQGKEMSVLTTTTSLNSFPVIRSEFAKIMQAEYAAHAVCKLTRPGNIEHGIFELFFNWLSVIEQNVQVFDSRFLDWFMLQLMGLIGFKPSYSACVQCGRIDDLTYWSYLHGGTVCTTCASSHFQGDSLFKITEVIRQDFARLNDCNFEQLESASMYVPEVHSLILGSLQYHSEVKIGDWEYTLMV